MAFVHHAMEADTSTIYKRLAKEARALLGKLPAQVVVVSWNGPPLYFDWTGRYLRTIRSIRYQNTNRTLTIMSWLQGRKMLAAGLFSSLLNRSEPSVPGCLYH